MNFSNYLDIITLNDDDHILQYLYTEESTVGLATNKVNTILHGKGFVYLYVSI